MGRRITSTTVGSGSKRLKSASLNHAESKREKAAEPHE
jgi:hypothetical protein